MDLFLGHDGCKQRLLLKVCLESTPTGIDPGTTAYLCYVLKSSVHNDVVYLLCGKLLGYTIGLVMFCGLINYD